MTKIKIEKGVPMAHKETRGRAAKYPFLEMDVTDSFFIECADDPKEYNSKTTSVRLTSQRAMKKHKKDWEFKIVKEKNGFRVFRVK